MNGLTNREIKSVKQFNKWADTYEKNLWSIYFNSVYRKAISIVGPYLSKNSRILDLGCGSGKLLSMLSEVVKKGELVGIDISARMIKVARDGYKKNNIKFIVGRVNLIPHSDDFFDLVFCLNSFHHFPNHKEVLNEIYRVLDVDGTFIFLDLITNNLIRKLWIFILNFLLGERKVEYHSESELLKLFYESGLEVITKRTFWFFAILLVLKKNK